MKVHGPYMLCVSSGGTKNWILQYSWPMAALWVCSACALCAAWQGSVDAVHSWVAALCCVHGTDSGNSSEWLLLFPGGCLQSCMCHFSPFISTGKPGAILTWLRDSTWRGRDLVGQTRSLSMLIWNHSTYCCDSFSPNSTIIHVKCEMNWIYSSITLK